MPTNYEPLVLTIEPAYVGSAVSPTVDITETSEDVTVTITDFRGEHSYTVEKTDGAIADAEAAADNANAAATEATAKGQQAVDIAQAAAASATATAGAAANNANAKAALADTAATAANTAAGNADDAASGARAATVDTQAATSAANTATSNANAATSAANTAAQNADAKAALANTAASNADAKATLANTAASNADTKATLANNAATSATSAASDASTAASSANEAAANANTAATAADTAREAIQDDLAAKADKDGYYPLLSAGTSDALLSGDSTLVTFTRRVSDHDGACRVESLRGRTVVWNQLNANNGQTNNTGLTRTFNADGSVTINGTTSTSNGIMQIGLLDRMEGHKYLIKGGPQGGSSSTYFFGINTSQTDMGEGGIYISSLTGNVYSTFCIKAEGITFDNITFFPQIFDLTAMFGAGNEPATVAEFEALYPESYYPYNAGTLLPVNMEGVETVGFNQWDEEWELGIWNQDGEKYTSNITVRSTNYIPVFPSTTYYVKAASRLGNLIFRELDADKKFIKTDTNVSNGTIITDASCRYLVFCTLAANNITSLSAGEVCINLSDPTLNGTYKPYHETTREIPAATYFPSGMKSVGSVYDELTSSKAITRIGSRAYQSGDEGNTSVITDGTTTHYALSTPVVVDIDPPLNLAYPVEADGTESIVIPTGEQSAAPTLVTVYAYDADGIVDKSQSIVAPVEGARASANYSVGSYLVQSGTLYRVTTAIATGEAINPGSNVTATTVMAELIRLTA